MDTFSQKFEDFNKAIAPKSLFTKETRLAELFTGGGINLINLAFFLIGFFFFASATIAAFQYILSQGDPKAISSASSRLSNSLLGLGFALLSFVLVRIVALLFGLGEDIIPFN